MSAQTVTRTPASTRQIFIRYRWALIISLLGLLNALAIYRFVGGSSAPAHLVGGSQVPYVDPAQQSVMSYVRAHESVAENRSFDPAQQGILDYLGVHESVAESNPLDPAQQSVMSYVRAHESVAENGSFDPAQQGILDYLRVHESVAESNPLDPAQQSVMSYLWAHSH